MSARPVRAPPRCLRLYARQSEIIDFLCICYSRGRGGGALPGAWMHASSNEIVELIERLLAFPQVELEFRQDLIDICVE